MGTADCTGRLGAWGALWAGHPDEGVLGRRAPFVRVQASIKARKLHVYINQDMQERVHVKH